MGADGGPIRGWFGEAAGLARVRPGFAWSADLDALFALGWPHLRWIVDGTRADEAPAERAGALLVADAPPRRLVWPRLVATAFVRALGAAEPYELVPGARTLRPAAEERLWDAESVTPAEAAELVGRRVTRVAPGLSTRAVETHVLLLEALVGPAPVGEAIVGGLEALPPDALLVDAAGPATVSAQLGYLLLRVPDEVARAWRDRLGALVDGLYAVAPELRRGARRFGATHARSLRLALGGGAAAEADTDRTPPWYTHTHDDAALVRARVALDRTGHEPDARLVFLGGPAVLERYARVGPGLPTTEAQAWFLGQMAPIRDERTFELMLGMAVASRVRAAALDWFRARGEEGRAWLFDAARAAGARGAWARGALVAIDG